MPIIVQSEYLRLSIFCIFSRTSLKFSRTNYKLSLSYEKHRAPSVFAPTAFCPSKIKTFPSAVPQLLPEVYCDKRKTTLLRFRFSVPEAHDSP